MSCQLPRSWVRTASLQGLGAASSSPGSCHSRHSYCSLYLSDNDIVYLMGSSGWFLFYVLQEFSISLSPPPSADENDGVHDSNCRGTFLSLLRTSEKGHRGWPETRVAASPLRGDQR